ncbi:MAG: sulfur carrier protein ThiS [Acidiferrobacterales bacterium]
MKILLNGHEKILDATMNVASLLCTLGLAEKRVAVEVNREIVPRSQHAARTLRDDDQVEVVVAIGGG